MPLSFPSNPILDQTTSTGGTTWAWDGETWMPYSNLGYTGSAGYIGQDGYVGSQGPYGYTGSAGSDATVPKITNIQVTDSSYTVIDDTAVDIAGGYIKIVGTGFSAGCQVLINNVPAASTTFVSSTEIRAQVSATAAGTYVVYVVSTDGAVAIRVNGITFSATPSWVTGSTLDEGLVDVQVTIQLSATGASVYALQQGSTLPNGLTLTSGGLLSGTVSGLSSAVTYSFTVVATDAENQDSPRTFSITISTGDPYFKLTTLAITGDSGTTIVTDSSTNTHNITVIGDCRSTGFSPMHDYWSVDVAWGETISWNRNAWLNLANSNFTIEFWLYPRQPGGVYGGSIYGVNQSGRGDASWVMFTNDRKVGLGTAGVGNLGPILSNSILTLNSWTHVAITSTGTDQSAVQKVFINGSLDNTISNGRTAIVDVGSNAFTGSRGDAYYNIDALIYNFRITKNEILYTNTFTPSPNPLTTSSNTHLLLYHNRQLTNSGNYSSDLISNSGRVRPNNPLGISNTGTTGSMYFDGSGDYLTVPNNALFNPGTNNFTVEAWIYTTTLGSLQVIYYKSESDGTGILLAINNGTAGRVNFYVATGGAGWNIAQIDSSTLITSNSWNHIAGTRNGNVFTLWLNGVSVGTNTNSGSVATTSDAVKIGRWRSAQTYEFSGYMYNYRFLNGTAAYTSNFTPPTSPFTATSNTALLTLQNRQPHNNHSFQDASSNNFLITRYGNTTQGTFSPFSQTGWGNYFSGSSQYLSVANNTGFDFGSSNFTIEAWAYFTSFTSTNGNVVVSKGASGSVGADFYSLQATLAGVIHFYFGSSSPILAGATLSANRWYHLAVTRSGNNFTLWVDGASSTTATSSATLSSGGPLIIGSQSYSPGASDRSIYGYVSNLRIVKTIAVYTGNFTPPTSPLTATQSAGTNIAAITGTETSILTCQSNRFVDNSSTPKTITVTGSPSVQAFSPFASTAAYSPAVHGGSAYFNGSGDYLEMSYNIAFKYAASQDFCLELWAYATSSLTANYIISQVTTNNWGFIFGVGSVTSGRIGVYFGNGATNAVSTLDDTSAFPINQWTHVVWCRTGSTMSLFVNGTRRSTQNNTNAINLTTDRGIRIGAHQDGSAAQFWPGYLSNLRSIIGSNPYDATQTTLTIPTSPFTATTNTSFLLNFNNAAIRDATSRNAIETAGDIKSTNVISKWVGLHSMYFDGTGDWLFSRGSLADLTNFGAGDFTIEAWVRFSDLSGTRALCGKWGGTSNRGWFFYYEANNIYFSYSTTGSNATDALGSWTPSINTWYYVAVTRSGANLRLYVDGSQKGTTHNISTLSIYASTSVFSVAQRGDDFGALNGYLQDLRITRGYARYTANFTPPTSTFKLR